MLKGYLNALGEKNFVQQPPSHVPMAPLSTSVIAI